MQMAECPCANRPSFGWTRSFNINNYTVQTMIIIPYPSLAPPCNQLPSLPYPLHPCTSTKLNVGNAAGSTAAVKLELLRFIYSIRTLYGRYSSVKKPDAMQLSIPHGLLMWQVLTPSLPNTQFKFERFERSYWMNDERYYV